MHAKPNLTLINMVQNLDNYQHMMENNEHLVDMKQLPPGFRFDPTDEELVLHFLYSKLKVSSSSPNSHDNNNNLNLIIPELEDFFDRYHPCQLHGNYLSLFCCSINN